MKYKKIFFSIIIGLSCAFYNTLFAQKKTIIPWEVATKDSINDLITKFGWSMDLYFINPTDEKFNVGENRQNSTGVEMFKSLFAKYGEDSTIFKNRVITNFIDTAYIRLINEFSEGCNGDPNCRKNALSKLLNLSNKKVSVNEYLLLQERYYNNVKLDPGFFPGSHGALKDSSVFIDKIRTKIAANTYAVNVYAKIDFSGFCEVDKAPHQGILTDLKLGFRVEFEQIKNRDGIWYRNYRIGEIFDIIDPGDEPPPRKHIINIEPNLSFGILNPNANFSNNELGKSFEKGFCNTKEFGVFFEREMNLFKNPNTKFSLATGVSALNMVMNSSIINGYAENTDKEFTDIPFTPSDFLKEYSLESTFRNVTIKDNHWHIGLPVRVGVDFAIDRNNKLRGYLKSMITYYLPVGSSTKSSGTLNQKGKFTYEHIPGFQTIVYMGGADNPFPEYYGVKDVYSQNSSFLGNGIGSKTEFGLSFDLKNNNYLNVGPYFSFGSFKSKGVINDYLAEEGGEVKSPYSTLSKLSYINYGISISMGFEILKTIMPDSK